jgi:transcriptional regulator with XRE-family HTH domain
MDKKKLLKKIGSKLLRIREPYHFSNREMAERLGVDRSSYCRYENGESPPNITVLYRLGKEHGISLDWLILDRGPRRYEEKGKEDRGGAVEVNANVMEISNADVREMVRQLEQDPRLRYEILLHYFNQKEKRTEPGKEK